MVGNCSWRSPFPSAMLSCTPKLSTYRLPFNSMPRTLLPHFAYVNEHAMYSTCGAYLVKNISPCVRLRLSSSFEGPYSCRAVHKDDVEQVKSDFSEEPKLTEKIQIESREYILESVDTEEGKEIQRKKIEHGNKGKRPWNKGLKHSEETLERIRRRTKEALQDPKVKKKMCEAQRALSDQIRVRISAAQAKIWGERRKRKRSRERLMQLWAESIAKAAKIGGIDQQELEWDSYDKLKQEIALLHIQSAEEKAKAKEVKRIRAARAKAEKMARLAQKRREQEENARARGESVRKRTKRSKEEKEKLAESQEVKLKERLMKIHKKKSAVNQVSNQHQRPWEKLDLDIVKTEQLQTGVTLADQIRFAKKRREAEQLIDKF